MIEQVVMDAIVYAARTNPEFVEEVIAMAKGKKKPKGKKPKKQMGQPVVTGKKKKK